MWMKIGIGVLTACVLIAGGIVATRPDRYSVVRSAVVAAPPEVVFDHVNDFRRWEAWSPFEDLEPTMAKTYEGAASGVDARYHWKGIGKAGEGRMRIAESEPARRIVIDLQFIEPFESRARTTFRFEPVSNGTRVTWEMAGRNTTMGKVISLVASMDAMLGKEFEKGLARLAVVAEGDAQQRAQGEAPAADVARAQ